MATYYNYQTKELKGIVDALDNAIDAYIQEDIHIVKHILQEVLSSIKPYEKDKDNDYSETLP